MRLSAKPFEAAARETVPGMRAMMAEMGVTGADVTPSVRMTAEIEIEGKPARVRVTVELDPEDEQEE